MVHDCLTDHQIKNGDHTYSSAIASANRYMDWMLAAFKSYLHGNIVEVGIGHGSYYERLAPFGNYWGVDIDEKSIQAARERFPEGQFAKIDILEPGCIENLLPGGADAIVSINVLEHVGDDSVALKNLVGALKSGGRLMISVPAMMGLYNDLDRLAGHHRRYSVDDFKRMLMGLPVAVEKLCYFNPIGAIGWWANRFYRHSSLNSGAVNGQIELFDRYALPVSRLVDPLTRCFFGQSVICIVRRL